MGALNLQVSLKSVKEETDESINETENQVAKISEINGAYLNTDSSEISKNKFGKNTVKKKKEKEKIVQNDNFSSGLKAGNSSQSKTIANQNGNEEIIKSSDSKKKIIYQSEKKRTLKNNSKGFKQQKKIKLSNSFNSDSI